MSPKERAKTNHKRIRADDTVICFYRASVLANLLLVEVVTKTGSLSTLSLSKGHLDRVSFSSQSIGTLSPHKDHHTIGVSCLDYN